MKSQENKPMTKMETLGFGFIPGMDFKVLFTVFF